MRIGIDIKAFKNGTTGISRYLRNIMDWLQKLDTTNTYFLFECTPSDYTVINPRWKKVLLPWKFPGIIWQQFILPRHLRAFGIDILWAPEQICPVFYRGAVFTTVHDLAAVRFPRSCQRSNFLIQKYLFPVTIKRSTRLLPVSDFVGRELCAFYPKLVNPAQMTTISNGSPDWECRHEVAARPKEPFLFFAGNREPRKNLGRLIDAMEILQREGMPVKLHLAGPPGWKNRNFHAKIAASPVRESIRFLGYLSEEELKEHYRTCAAVVYPSLYEGFGLPLLEALCLGARVVTSRGTVMEEIAGPAARYFDPFDSRDIAKAIRATLEEPPPSVEELRLFRQVLGKYSWERNAREMLRLFEWQERSTST
ncbi:MAG: glycosyltransferase family 4 protein [Chitinispirillaceae bacterium]|nr:glycosyltransferase family 4 protein [Chitinispirillaceae bacterium]